jgi:NADPH:quinone reductase-like Zn-dependent oxidoreductase
MQRIEVERYGRLTVRDVEQPVAAGSQVLVRVVASSVNAVDWYGYAGRPYAARPMMGIRRPRSRTIGGDFAGVVEGVGEGASGFRPGDEVFGVADGAFGSYVLPEDVVHHAPSNVSLDEAAAIPIAGFTALQGLRDHAAVRAGQRVLVNGASGGVGTFALQVAAAFGAEVHAVCSTTKVDQARELGATRVFDYTREDFSRSGERYDVIFDNAGSRSWHSMRRVLAPDGIVVLVGGPRSRRMLGPLGHVLAVKVAATLARRRAVFFIAKPNRKDLIALGELVETNRVSPIVERRYGFDEVGAALDAIGEGHARAKLVLSRLP